MAKWLERVSAPFWIQNHHQQHWTELKALSHRLVLICQNKWCMYGQKLQIEILDWNTLINTYYHIGVDWTWSGFEKFLFKDFLLSAHQTSIWEKWELIAWNLGQIFEIKQLMVGQYHSRWWFSEADFSKFFSIDTLSLPSQCRSLQWVCMAFRHCFSFATFFFSKFGCKLCLQFIVIDARDHFQVFEHRYLMWLCCLIGIWTDSHFLDR